MDKKEFRVLIKYWFLKGKNTVEAKSWLDTEFPNTAPGKSTIKDWYAKFRRREMSTEDGVDAQKRLSLCLSDFHSDITGVDLGLCDSSRFIKRHEYAPAKGKSNAIRRKSAGYFFSRPLPLRNSATAPALVHTDRIAVTFMPIAPLVSTIALKRADAAAPSSTPPRPGSPMSYSDDKEIGEISRNRTGKCR
ncbi:hypothetical protein GWI33_004404 [Rhynchophorus ferrugineus]|uniref:Mos1 transposase HTH domain-containing protein n=1 Tax=Rhynchophorus ferrugineus TaxID=354439 RepID=A0A834MFH6_RHYFE|nr:hypothetical protein GWI33_004404 [Rhynchophorus ferrugineus]